MINILFELGLLRPFAGLIDAIFLLVVPIAIVVIGCKLIGGREPVHIDFKITDSREKKFYKNFFYKYPIWGFIQQILFMAPVYLALNRLMPGNPYNVVLTSLFFGMLHFPNFILMFSTGGMVMIFLVHFNMYHNIYILGIIHGMIATTLQFYLPRRLATNFQVWGGYISTQRKVNDL